MTQQLAKRWFTVDEYDRMAQVGILSEEDRVELIEGEIVRMSPIGSRHAACVNRLNMLLSPRLGETFIVSVQNPVVVSDHSELQPDLMVLHFRDDYYASAHPRASDVVLLIEVADTSVDTDRDVKMPLYARGGIPVVMLVDLPDESIEVHTDPVGERYASIHRFRRGETLSLDVLPFLHLTVDNILG